MLLDGGVSPILRGQKAASQVAGEMRDDALFHKVSAVEYPATSLGSELTNGLGVTSDGALPRLNKVLVDAHTRKSEGVQRWD